MEIDLEDSYEYRESRFESIRYDSAFEILQNRTHIKWIPMIYRWMVSSLSALIGPNRLRICHSFTADATCFVAKLPIRLEICFRKFNLFSTICHRNHGNVLLVLTKSKWPSLAINDTLKSECFSVPTLYVHLNAFESRWIHAKRFGIFHSTFIHRNP